MHYEGINDEGTNENGFQFVDNSESKQPTNCNKDKIKQLLDLLDIAGYDNGTKQITGESDEERINRICEDVVGGPKESLDNSTEYYISFNIRCLDHFEIFNVSAEFITTTEGEKIICAFTQISKGSNEITESVYIKNNISVPFLNGSNRACYILRLVGAEVDLIFTSFDKRYVFIEPERLLSNSDFINSSLIAEYSRKRLITDRTDNAPVDVGSARTK